MTTEVYPKYMTYEIICGGVHSYTIHVYLACIFQEYLVVQEISADFHGKSAKIDERMPLPKVVPLEVTVDFP